MLIIIGVTVSVVVYRSKAQREQLHYERAETELIVTKLFGATSTLFKAGKSLQDAVAMPPLNGERLCWHLSMSCPSDCFRY